jgi:hypothetical protein
MLRCWGKGHRGSTNSQKSVSLHHDHLLAHIRGPRCRCCPPQQTQREANRLQSWAQRKAQQDSEREAKAELQIAVRPARLCAGAT